MLQRIDLGDRVAIAPAPSLQVTGFAADTLVRDGARPRSRQPQASSRAGARRSRSGSRSRPASAAAAPTPRPRSGSRTTRSPTRCPASACDALAATLGADVPFFLATGPQLGRGDGSELEPLDLPQDYWVVLALPHGAGKDSTAAVYRALRRARRRAAAGRSGARRSSRRSPPCGGRATSPRCPPNDLASSPLAAELLAARRLPRRRQRRRPDRLRPLPPPAPRRGRAACAPPRRAHVADGSQPGTAEARTVALSYGSPADDRARQQPLRPRAAREPAPDRARRRARRGHPRPRRRDPLVVGRPRRGSSRSRSTSAAAGRPVARRSGRSRWIFAVSQLAVVLVPALALVPDRVRGRRARRSSPSSRSSSSSATAGRIAHPRARGA